RGTHCVQGWCGHQNTAAAPPFDGDQTIEFSDTDGFPHRPAADAVACCQLLFGAQPEAYLPSAGDDFPLNAGSHPLAEFLRLPLQRAAARGLLFGLGGHASKATLESNRRTRSGWRRAPVLAKMRLA